MGTVQGVESLLGLLNGMIAAFPEQMKAIFHSQGVEKPRLRP
jgi:hypothetical protein